MSAHGASANLFFMAYRHRSWLPIGSAILRAGRCQRREPIGPVAWRRQWRWSGDSSTSSNPGGAGALVLVAAGAFVAFRVFEEEEGVGEGEFPTALGKHIEKLGGGDSRPR